MIDSNSEHCPNCGYLMEPIMKLDSSESFNVIYYHCDICDYDSIKSHELIVPTENNFISFFYQSEGFDD